MALRDWYGWQIGTMWGIGVAMVWALGRVGATIVHARSRMGGAGRPPLWVTGVTVLIVMALLMVTVRWARARFLDE